MDDAIPLWQQMIEASDRALQGVVDVSPAADAAIAAAHLQAVRERLVPQLRTTNPRAAQRLWELLTDEILATFRPSRIATKSKGGPADPPNHAPSDATVAASGGEAEAPLTNPQIFRS